MNKNPENAAEETKKETRDPITVSFYVLCLSLFLIALIFGFSFPTDLSSFPTEKQHRLQSVVVFFKCLSYVALFSSTMIPFPLHGLIPPNIYRGLYFFSGSTILLCVYITNQYFAIPIGVFFLFKFLQLI